MSQFVDGKFQIKNTNVTLPLGNKLGIGITNSTSELDVHGTFQISKEYDNSSIPSTPANNKGGILYVKSTDGRLYYKSNGVSEKDLTANATGSGEINTMLNLGASASGAVGIYDRKDDAVLKLKTLKAGQNIVLTTDHNHIMITSTASGGGGGGGTVTDGINEGIDNGGKGIFIDSLNEALRFRSVRGITSTGIKTETNNVTSTIDFTYTRGHLIEKGDTNIIVIDETGQTGGYIKFTLDGNEKLRIIDNGNLGIGVTNPDESIELDGRIHFKETTEPSTVAGGDGGKLYVKNDGKLYFKSNHELTPKSIVDSVSNVTNLGTSNNNLFRSKNGENLEFRSLKAGNNIIISTENNEIVLTSAGGAYRGPGGSKAEYMVKKTRFISAPSQWGANTLGITSTAINGDNTTITTSSAHNISFTSGDVLNIYITGTSASNTELNGKYHEIISASGSTIEIKTKTTAVYTGGTLQLNYGNYTNTSTSKNLTHLDHSLGAGYHYIFVTWTSKFNDRPLDDQILELYHKSSVFSDGVDANLTGATLLQTIYRSNANSDYHSMSQAFYLSIPEATTYYFRWIRKSRGEYHWGTDSLQMTDELINVDYITPSLNFWSLSQYTANTGFNYPIIHYGTGTTLGGRVGIGTTIPDADMEIAGTIHISEAQSTDPPAPLDRNDGGILYVKNNGHLYFRNYLKTVDMVTVATGGEANFLETRGNGVSINIDKFESDIRIRSFIGGNGIGVTTTSSNEIEISTTNMLSNGYLGIGISTPDNMLDVNGGLGLREIASPNAPGANNGGVIWTSTDGKLYFKSNEINTGRELSDYVIGTNIGSGVGIYKQRTNDNLEFKKITSGNAQITVTDDTSNDSIKLTNNITLNNADSSTGTSLIKNTGIQTDYQLKTITGGTGVSIGTDGDHTLIINSTGGGGSGGSVAYSGAGGSGAEYMSRKAYFSNSADITISSISQSGVNKTVINTATNHGISFSGTKPNQPSVIKITGANGSDSGELNGKFHNVIEVADNDTFIIDTNTTTTNLTAGTVSLNYDNYLSSGNPINLHTLDHSLSAGKHYIFVNWNSNFNENPLDDQELELYYLTGSSYTETINVAITGIKLDSLYRTNSSSNRDTISKTIYVEVPNGQTYNLRWIRKSNDNFGWSAGISNLIDEKITVDYITPELNYWTLGQHNIAGTNYPTVYFGESSTNTSLGRVGIGISTPLQPLHVKGNSFYDGNVGIGDNNPGTKLQITGSEPYLTLKNSTDENNDGGCESRIIFEDHSNTALGQIQCSHNGILVDTRSDLIFSTNDGSSLGEKMRIDSDGNIGIGTNDPHASLDINNTNPYTLGEFDYSCDSIFLYGHGSVNGNRYGGITWGNPDGRRRAGISAIAENNDTDYVGLSFCTQGTNGSGPFAESMRITHGGNVLIEGNGTTDSGIVKTKQIQFSQRTNSAGGGIHTWYIKVKDNENGAELQFRNFGSSTNIKARILWHGTNVTLNFTGQHRSFMDQYSLSQLELLNGLIVCANKNKYTRMSDGIAKGKNAITINESLPDLSICNKDKDKSVFGVISNLEDPNERKEQIGAIIAPIEKENGDTRPYINSVGEGAIWVADKNGNLESGDYITSCTIPGYGMKQDSEFLANYSVAKITMDCDFNPVTQPVEQIVKDSEGNNILDSNGYLQWENHATETEKAYNLRYLLADGTQITEADYTTRKSNGENVYKAAFVGCTYHCG